MTLKDLKEYYKKLPQEYATLLKTVEEQPVSIAYASVDFFSKEPFFVEYNHLRSEKLKLETSIDDLEGDEIFSLAIANHKVIHSRNYMGGEVFYDSFYQYKGNSEYRYELYKNAETIKSVAVEYLEKGENGENIVYRKYGMYGAQEQVFTYKDNTIDVDITYFDEKLTLQYKEKREVFLNEERTVVEKIMSYTGEMATPIYDADMVKMSFESLLGKCKAAICKSIKEGIIAHPPTEKNICLTLLEYTMQGPFPPTVAMGTVEERKELTEEYGNPLVWINAPDMSLFSESDTLKISFDDRPLYDELNSRVTDMEFETVHSIIKKTYIDICKALKKDKELHENLHVTTDYQVTARDFEACNEAEFLEKILPKKEWQKINKTIQEHEEEIDKEYKNDPDIIRINKVLDEQEMMYTQLVEKANVLQGDDYYQLNGLIYTIKPLGEYLEAEGKEVENVLDKLTKEKPKVSSYYHYKMLDDKPYVIYHYIDGVLVWEHYFNFESTLHTHHLFHTKETPILEKYEELHLQNGYPIQFYYYGGLEYDELTYTLKEGEIVQMEGRKIMHYQMKMESALRYDIAYQEDKLHSVYCTYNENQYMVYAIDNSFMDLIIDEIVNGLLIVIMKSLRKETVKNSQALVILYNTFFIHVNTVQKDALKRLKIKGLYDALDNKMITYNTYKDRFTQEENEVYDNSLYQKLITQLKEEIEAKMKLSVKIFYQKEDEDTEWIIKELANS